jgi:hypothetical protein
MNNRGTIMRNFLSVFSFIIALSIISGCSSPYETEEEPQQEGIVKDKPLPIADEGQYIYGEAIGLQSGGYKLLFESNSGIYGVAIYSCSEKLFWQETPAYVNVYKNGAQGITIVEKAYDSVTKHSAGWIAASSLKTASGTEFVVSDIWFVVSEGAFCFSRTVEVVSSNANEKGFSSAFVLNTGISGASPNYDVTLPSLVYKDSTNIPASAVGANLDVPELFVKETYTGMPFVMIRDRIKGQSIAVSHYNPKISSGLVGGGSDGQINGSLQFGSLGFIRNGKGLSTGFIFPAKDTPVSYTTPRTRYHPIEKGFKHSYKLAIIPKTDLSYTDAFSHTVKKIFDMDHAQLYEVDSNTVFDESIKTLDTVYREYGSGSLIGAGFPFYVHINNINNRNDSWQMGFIGAQTSLGAQLMEAGYLNNNDQWKKRGKRIIDFWTSAAVFPNSMELPVIWWQPSNNANAGNPRNYPSFLRTLCDGMDGIFEAYKIKAKYDTQEAIWLASVLKVASFFKDHQQYDGSLFRAYNTTGIVNTDPNPNYQGSSKLNTAAVVPLFAKISDYYSSVNDTGNSAAYRNAAIKAVDYIYDELYIGLEKYVGGTPDNPNVVDKEAGVYALRAFNAAYLLTKDDKYLKAAEHAACFVLTFVYNHDFAVSTSTTYGQYNPFINGGTSGFSLIATGHTAADIFASAASFDFYKTYLINQDSIYKDMAIFIQNNSKYPIDWDGRFGYASKAFAPEASNIAEFNYQTVEPPGVWLPWMTDVIIRPMMDIYNIYGVKDLRHIPGSFEEQKSIIEEYGLGGKNKQ